MTDFHGNPQHLELVKKGPVEINRWRKKYHIGRFDLRGADLEGINLDGANLSSANLRGASLRYASLNEVYLIHADLEGANLSGASFMGTHFDGANLSSAILYRADLRGTDLYGANLDNADLTNVYFTNTNLCYANINKANFTNARLGGNSFLNTDLSVAKGLETCSHHSPSALDVSILRIAGKLPRQFLQGIGLPDDMIDYLPDFFESAVNFYSLFISYSTEDEEFADQLYSDLQSKGVRCWYSPADTKGGEWLDKQVEMAISFHDRVLPIISEDSMKSEWVISEINAALKREKKENRRVLFPIRLVDFDIIKKWDHINPDVSFHMVEKVTRYFIPDFSQAADYHENFNQLIRDLKA